MPLEIPDDAQHEQLMAFVEERDQRRQQRLGQLAMGPDVTKRGRKGVDTQINPDGSLFPPQESLSELEVIDYAKRNQARLPLFNKFTDHAHVEPTKESIDQYCMGANREFFRARYKREKAGETSEKLSRYQVKALQRQTMHVSDSLQRSLFIDRNIARLRRASIATVQHQIRLGETQFDHEVVTHTISAVRDFGLSVWEDALTRNNPSDVEFGFKVASLAELAEDKPEILRDNMTLLRLVRLDQKAHDEYWSERYSASIDVLGDRLVKDDHQAGKETREEIKRLNRIQGN